MSTYYKLVGKKVVPMNDVVAWGKSFGTNRNIQKDTTDAGYLVSTIFLGLDYRFGSGKPLLFETMVFDNKGEKNDVAMTRYTTYNQAEKGHANMIKAWSTNEVALRKIEE